MGLKNSCKYQKLPMLVFFAIFRPVTTIKTFSARFPARFPARLPTAFPAGFPTAFPTRFHTAFPAEIPARFSCKICLSWILIGWLPITLFQMLNFYQSLPLLNWLFPLLPVPQDFPARISPKIFLHDFPIGFSCKIFLSWILIGWLTITLFQMLNFHQSLLC